MFGILLVGAHASILSGQTCHYKWLVPNSPHPYQVPLDEAHLPANTEAFADPRLDLIIDDCKVQLEQATEAW